MSVLGWFLAVFGVAGVVYALRMMSRMKKMQTVPFHVPSAIQNGSGKPDAKGMISTEGQPVAGGTLLTAPMSGQPCLAYEIVVERKWEKSEETENGTKTKSGSDKIHSEYKGSRFDLSDGAGIIVIDLAKEPDGEFEKSHNSTVKIGMTIPGSLAFGQMQMNTPSLPRDSRTVAFVATEKVLKAGGTLYAMGALKGGAISAPDGMLGKVLLSSKGRSHLLASTKKHMTLGYAVGGPLALAGVLLGLFGPKPAPGNGCKDFAAATSCDGRIYSASGDDLKWTVPADGRYRLTVKQPAVKRPIDATITVTDSMGKQIAYNDGGSPGADALVEQKFAAGSYTVNVRDFAKHKVSGGYGYKLWVEEIAEAKAPAVAANIAPSCQAAADCCVALKGSPSACAPLLSQTGDACDTMMTGFRRSARHSHNKQALATCQ